MENEARVDAAEGKASGRAQLRAQLRAPFPYFGGKSRVADVVWQALGDDCAVYVEPFFGSGAVLLARPLTERKVVETINDKDCLVANFWRAVQRDPDAVAYWADFPVSERDLHARQGFLANRRARLAWALEDPDYFDAKIAGWWCWAMSSSLAGQGGRLKGRWRTDGVHFVEVEKGRREGREWSRSIPQLSSGCGVHRTELRPQRGLPEALAALAERLRMVRILCGDWERAVCSTATTYHGLTAVFLDPPYGHEATRDGNLYGEDDLDVAARVRAWCKARGADARWRIVLAGYAGEHDELEGLGWRVFSWSAQGGLGNLGGAASRGAVNRHRERLWLSPHTRTIS